MGHVTSIAEASQDTIEAILAMFPPEVSPRSASQPVSATPPDEEQRKVRRALRNVPSDDHDQWVFVGMALKATFTEAVARVEWDEWSRKSERFDERDQNKRWRSFKKRTGGKGIGYVYMLAKQYEPNWWREWRSEEDRLHAPPNQTSGTTMASATTTAPPTRSNLRARLRDRSEILSLAPTRALIKGYATCGSVIVVGAEPNLGKSTLANGWAHCIWTGHAWLGHRVLPGSVLFLLGEDLRGASLRAKAWEEEYGPCVDIGDRYIEYADKMPPLCASEGQLELRRMLLCLKHERRHAPAMVVIDTLSTVWGSEPENAAELAAALMAVLSSLADEFGCTFVLIHHLNKVQPGPAKREITLSSIRGAGAFVGSADDVLVLEAVEEGVARLFGIKARNTDKAPAKVLRVHRVHLGTNEDGDEVTSVILVDAPPTAVPDASQVEQTQRDKAWTAAEERIQRAVESLRKLGKARSKTAIANRMVGKRSEKFAAVDDAIARELIIDLGTDRAHKFVVAEDHQRVSCKTPHTPEEGTGNRSPAGAGPDSVPSGEGTGSQERGTGNRLQRVADEDDGLPEQPQGKRKARGKGNNKGSEGRTE